jgi:two-component system, cell cycle sensor histidine kinase and response regulator CckA
VTSHADFGSRQAPAKDIVGDRHSLVLIGMAAVWAACVAFGAARLVITLSTGKLTPWWANVAGAVAISALFLWYRRHPLERSAGAASGTALVATVALLVPVAYGMSSTVWWLGLVGFAMVLLGRRREAWAWGVTIPVLVVVAHFAEPSVQLEGAAGEPPIEQGMARIVFVVLLIGMATAFREVAERRVRERTEELRRSREVVANILNSIPQSVSWKDTRSVYVGCNQVFAQAAGLADPADIAGKTDFDLPWRDRAEAYRAGDREVIESGRPRRELTQPVQTPDSRRAWVSTTKVPLTDETGAVLGVLGVFEDITERKAAEEALRESEARYRSLFDQSPLGIYQTTPDGRILAANLALLRMLGYSTLEELAARDLELDGYEPNYPRRNFKELIERDGEVMALESAWLKRDGEVLRVRESARAVRDGEGRTLHYEGTVEDVTAQRRGEEERRRLVAAVEQASETIVITDTEGRIEYVNPAFERTTGYTREEAIGQKPSLLKSGRQDSAYYATLWQTIARGEIWKGHFVNRRKDGALYEEEATISPIRDGRGAIMSFVAVKRDVTREAALQAQLRQAQKMEAVGTLAGGIAHDFNNLLQALLSSTQAARLQSRELGVDRTLAEIQSQVQRGTSLTRQLLLFSRQVPTQRERLDLAALVEEQAAMLRRLLPETIELAVDTGSTPTPVHADAGQLSQVLTNLVVNARDAMPGGGRLTISTACRGREVVLEVADSGVGMPPEVRERIFDPFFTTKPHGRGTGLGLTVVWGIARDHGGSVEVRSALGEGSTFRIVLPMGVDEGESSEPLPTLQAVPTGDGERVLLVEDEEGARQGLSELLGMLHYDVSAVASGEEAAQLPADPPFHLLLTDFRLPGATGLEVARSLSERWPAMKVVVMSGYAPDDLARDLFSEGAVHFLQKPFDMAALARALHAALQAPATPLG